jgi:hypothetical protein
MAKKWEYLVIAVQIDARVQPGKDVLQNDLNQMGKDGWELVTVAPRTTELNDGHLYVAIFKRLKSWW